MIINVAEKLCKKHGTRNPREIAEYLNIHILEIAFHTIYGISCEYKKNRLIGVNSSLPEKAKPFIIAHELGHFILHPKGNFFFVLDKTIFYSKIEYQANVFATALCCGEKIARQRTVKESLAGGNMDKLIRFL